MKATEGRAADVWHLVSVQGPAKVPFLSVLRRGPRLGYRLKLTLLPLTFPDDDAPEGGQLHNRIVGGKRRISYGSDGVRNWHATHPWLPLRIIWFAMAAFVWSIPFVASIWLNIEYINRISHGIRSFFDRQLNQKIRHFPEITRGRPALMGMEIIDHAPADAKHGRVRPATAINNRAISNIFSFSYQRNLVVNHYGRVINRCNYRFTALEPPKCDFQGMVPNHVERFGILMIKNHRLLQRCFGIFLKNPEHFPDSPSISIRLFDNLSHVIFCNGVASQTRHRPIHATDFEYFSRRRPRNSFAIRSYPNFF